MITRYNMGSSSADENVFRKTENDKTSLSANLYYRLSVDRKVITTLLQKVHVVLKGDTCVLVHRM